MLTFLRSFPPSESPVGRHNIDALPNQRLRRALPVVDTSCLPKVLAVLYAHTLLLHAIKQEPVVRAPHGIVVNLHHLVRVR